MTDFSLLYCVFPSLNSLSFLSETLHVVRLASALLPAISSVAIHLLRRDDGQK